MRINRKGSRDKKETAKRKLSKCKIETAAITGYSKSQ